MKISFENEVSGTDHDDQIGFTFTYGYYFKQDRVFGVKWFWRGLSYWRAITFSSTPNMRDCAECCDQYDVDDMYPREGELICEPCLHDSFEEVDN